MSDLWGYEPDKCDGDYCPNCGAEMEESTATNSTTDGDNSTTQKSVNKTEVNG